MAPEPIAEDAGASAFRAIGIFTLRRAAPKPEHPRPAAGLPDHGLSFFLWGLNSAGATPSGGTSSWIRSGQTL